MKHIHTPGGVTDGLPAHCARAEAVRGALLPLFQTFGYERLSAPMTEYADVFTRAGETDYQPFIGADGATYAIRPDMTPAVARIAATAYTEADLPLRFCYWENIYRRANPHQGKAREFTQAGADLIGAGGAGADAEAIALAVKALAAAGLDGATVYIGDAPLFDTLCERAGFDPVQTRRLRGVAAGRDFTGFAAAVREKQPGAALKSFLTDLPFHVGGLDVLDRASQFADLDRLYQLHAALADYGAVGKIAFDLGMTGQWGYYTGVIFRAYAPGAGEAILSGGRYDRLVGGFGADRPAVGFGVQIHLLLDALSASAAPAPDKPPVTMLAYSQAARGRALTAADELRQDGAVVVNAPEGLTADGAADYAKAHGAAGLLYFDETGVTAVDIGAGTREHKALGD